MNKHNNLINEIEGSYTKADFWFDAIIILAGVITVTAFALILLEVLGGADWLLEAVASV